MIRLLVLLATAGLAACVSGPNPEGIHVVNRTSVPLALGFSEAVAPCSEAFLSFDSIDDFTRDMAEGAWQPNVVWAPDERSRIAWIVVSEQGTDLRSELPAAVPPCGGEPTDWQP